MSDYKLRADGRYQMPVKLPNGKTKYLYAKSKPALKTKYNELCKQYLMGNIKEQSISLKEWSEIWYTKKEDSGISKSRLTIYNGVLNNYILPTIGGMDISDIKLSHLEQVINKMKDKSKSYQQEVVKVFNQMFDYAVDNDILNKNPCTNIKYNGKDAEEKQALTIEQQKTLLETTKGTRAELFVAIGLLCGLRRGEILALKWSDIKDNKLTVNKSVNYDENQPKNKKTKTKAGNRTIEIPPMLSEILSCVEDKTGYIIKSALGKQCSEMAYKRIWEIVINKLQKPTEKPLPEKEKRNNMIFYITPHILRHTYITTLYYAGVDLKTAQYLAGHANASTTLKIYTHLDNEALKTTSEKLSSYYEKLKLNSQN